MSGQPFRGFAKRVSRKFLWHRPCCMLSSGHPMTQRDLLKRWWGGAAVAALVLLILAASFCCFGLSQIGMDDHSMPMDLCLLALLLPAVLLLPLGLLPHVLAVNLGRAALTTVPIAVPKPPPRRSCFA